MKFHFPMAPAIFIKRCGLLILFYCIPFTAFCQPDYDFRNSSLVSGTDLQVNAIYLFQNVKPGVDATVTIKAITGGIVLSDIDSPWSGYVEALQPVLQVPALSSGYVEFEVDFLIAGTNTPMIQAEVPATPIDVDGQTYPDGIVNEFDILQLTNGYVDYDMLGGELSMTINSPWVTGVNVQTTDYPGVDTAPRQVMFTTVNAAISKFTFRTGATSLATDLHQRLRSIYFKKFLYPNSFLPVTSLASFSGSFFDNKISLQWKMQPGSRIKAATVERATGNGNFAAIAAVQLNTQTSTMHTYTFADPAYSSGLLYYRLKLISAGGQVQYSNTLLFRTADKHTPSFKIFPGIITDNATANIMAAKNEQVVLKVFDFNGHIVYQKKILLQQGYNSIALSGFSGLQKGTYIAAAYLGNTTCSQQIIIR